MTTVAAPLPPAPDQPLPAELSGRAQGWFTRYRRWPVFSAPWARERTLAWAVPVGVALLLVAGFGRANSSSGWPWAALLGLSFNLLIPLVAGPRFGAWVRRRAWPERVEGWALLAAVLAAVALTLGVSRVAGEPVKQWIAERIGDVDAEGKRRRIALHIGILVQPIEDRQPDAAAAAQRSRSADDASNLAVHAFVAFWLAGGFALVGWRRERAALAALARERELREAQAQRREAELRLSVLAAQVEPHFLFNTLAGVRSAIATDPARATTMIDRLVEYLRAAIPRLRSDGAVDATLGAQFELLRAYLGLMAARMPRLAWRVDAPADLLRARCPPLLLVSLVENAVKHGVEPKVGAARVDVGAARTDDGRLAIHVADDGVGFGGASAGTGLGLANIRERLAQLYGERASLALRSRTEGGVVATLTLPLDFE
ncbi:histidine kinase [Azohydromonas sp.]|uniref:histidine kinase n=1 Tax=Azohydromonas sp. TaxID=1872666 RepID=UPI002C7C5ED7|nr:histidine kinase [Azohydromonas sp.]HMM85205.1 histidine kinase [Azohydromonas sp.]